MATAKASKKKRSKTAKAENVESQQAPADAMSECVMLCQEKRWREALLLCRRLCAKAQKDGNPDLYVSLEGAQAKIEYSLRRQIAANLIKSAKQTLVKEYLLDVGE